MNLIVTESAQMKIDCNGSIGVGFINQGTIILSGPFTGSCTLTPTYDKNVTIDGLRVVSKLSMNITGFLTGTTPTTNGNGSIQGSTRNTMDDNQPFVTMNQTASLINGTCTTTSTPPTVIPFTANASFVNAGQTSTYGE